MFKTAIGKKFDLTESEKEAVLKWGKFRDLLKSPTKPDLMKVVHMRKAWVCWQFKEYVRHEMKSTSKNLNLPKVPIQRFMPDECCLMSLNNRALKYCTVTPTV